ncbi:MAG: ATP synthase F0 subunit C [Candidatus Omnitrophica bacterium]|nr:ATP synthase F0 subunit C [Candidatus Omnitrophota bacterium]
MTYQTALAFALPIAVGLAAIGSAFGLGKAVTAAMEATGRQPEAAQKILVNMVVGCALIEALTIYALVVALLMMGKIA